MVWVDAFNRVHLMFNLLTLIFDLLQRAKPHPELCISLGSFPIPKPKSQDFVIRGRYLGMRALKTL